MIVEKPELLKQWMSVVLRPLCDAEPLKLAKYVLALIKKDLTTPALRASVVSNLDIFLHDKTALFVDKLFAVLADKSYIKASPTPTSDSATAGSANNNNNNNNNSSIGGEKMTDQPADAPVIADLADNTADTTAAAAAASGRATQHHSPPAVSSRRRRAASPRDGGSRMRMRRPWDERRRARSPLPPLSGSMSSHHARYRPGRYRRRSRSLSGGRSTADAPPPLMSGRSSRRHVRSRTRSRSPLLGRSPNSVAAANAVSNKSPGRGMRANSGGGGGNGGGGGVSDSDSAAAAAICASDLRNKLNNNNATTTTVTGEQPVTAKQRCADFDEKGYCMSGDQCPFDHGLDPVVLKDVALPDVLKFGRAPPGGASVTGAAAAAASFNPHVHPPAVPGMEGYNPDAPSITTAPWPTAGPLPLPPVGASYNLAPVAALHPQPPPAQIPPPPGALYPAPLLVTVPVNRATAATALPNMSMPPPLHQPPPLAAAAGGASVDNKRVVWAGGVPHFDYRRLGGAVGRPRFSAANCSLELRKVPAALNKITHLNQHFSKFGNITNIQVSFGGDPAAALVTFARPVDAKAAYKCTEAVLNNRFIKLFWHNNNNNAATTGGGEEMLGQSQQRTEEESGGGVVMSVSAHNKTDTTTTTTTTTSDCPNNNNNNNNNGSSSKKAADIDAIQRSQQILAATLSLQAKTKEKQKEAQRLALDLRKRKHELLDKQLQQQKQLLQRLDSGRLTRHERATIVATIKELQQAIVSTRHDASAADAAANTSATATPATTGAQQATEKEMLDVEMELYQRQQEGTDTSELQRRVAQLKLQLRRSHVTTRGRHSAGRRFRSRRGAVFASSSLSATGTGGISRSGTSLDHRSTRVCVRGHSACDRPALITHLAKFGDITSVDEGDSGDEVAGCVRVVYATRQQAELAVLKARSFNGHLLSVGWDHVTPAPSTGQHANYQPQTLDAAAHTAANGVLTTNEHKIESDCADNGDRFCDSAAMADQAKTGVEEDIDEDDDEGEQDRSWKR